MDCRITKLYITKKVFTQVKNGGNLVEFARELKINIVKMDKI